MVYELANYHTDHKVPLHRDTLRTFFYVSKRPLRSGVLTLPGLLAVHSFSLHAGLTAFAMVLEFVGAAAILNILGLEALSAVGAGLGLILLDMVFAVVHVIPLGKASEAHNQLVHAQTDRDKDRFASRMNRARLFAGLFSFILMLIGIAKAAFFYVGANANGDVAPAWIITLALLYVLVAVLHIFCTGSFFAALMLNWRMRKDYVAWRDTKPLPPVHVRSSVLEGSAYQACDRGQYWIKLRDDSTTWELGCRGNLLDEELLDLANTQPLTS